MQQPITLAQTPFWKRFIQQPSANIDTVAHCVAINGKLDSDAFIAALNQTLSETEIFRTRFSAAGEMILAAFDMAPTAQMCDLSAVPQANHQAWQEMEKDAQTAVNLVENPLTLHRLYKISEHQFYWYTRAHHILLDGYGMMLFEQRCCQWYQHFTSGKTLSQPFKPYADYLLEEQRYSASRKYHLDRHFWQNYLDEDNLLTLTDADYDPNACREVCHQVLFEPRFATRLNAICQQLAIGWPDALVALTSLYLQQSPLSDNDESVVWLPFMNRWGSVAANIPGLMVNILPYKHKNAPRSNLKDYLLHCRSELRELYCHGRYRIEQIEQDHNLTAKQSYFMTPFINVMPFDAPHLPDCQLEHHVLAAGSAEGLNITFRGAPGSEQFCAFIEADVNSYSEAKLDQHAIDLALFFERLLDTTLLDSASLDNLLNRPLEPLLNQESSLAKSA
ncbi:condensation domain-containing protein [Vibrio xiamenensis]|nr:condensation domain-containing protein [Vibrio xiamenensis]